MFKRMPRDNNRDMELTGHVFFLIHLRIEIADIPTRPDRNEHDASNLGFNYRDPRSCSCWIPDGQQRCQYVGTVTKAFRVAQGIQ